MDENTESLAGVVGSCELLPERLGKFGESRLLLRPKEECVSKIVVGELARLVLPKGGSVWARVKGFEIKNLIPEGTPVAIVIEWPSELGTTPPEGTKVYVGEAHSIKGETSGDRT
jgi:hypothetical protein